MNKNITLITCADHPTYKAIRKPRPTKKNPKGCSICWEMWKNKNEKNKQKTRHYVVEVHCLI